MSGGAQLDASWWEALVAELVPGPQKAIIDTLQAATEALTEADLQVALEGEGRRKIGPRIRHHLGRLRALNAIDIEVSPTGPVRVRYCLTERPDRGKH